MKLSGISRRSFDELNEGLEKAISDLAGGFVLIIAEDFPNVPLDQPLKDDLRRIHLPRELRNSCIVCPEEGSRSSSASRRMASATPSSSSCRMAGRELRRWAAKPAR